MIGTLAMGIGAGAVSGVTSIATRAVNKARQMASRPTRAERISHRGRKGPTAWRAARAASHRAEIMANVAQDPYNQHSVPAIAHELTHLSGQYTKGMEDLTDYGMLPKGGFWENLKRGAIYINGQFFSFNTFLLSLIITKSMRLHHEPPAGTGSFLDGFVAQGAPVKVLFGARIVTATTTQKLPEDVFGIQPGGVAVLSTSAGDASGWPVGTTVFLGTVPHLVPDIKSAAKVAAGAFLTSREHPALKLVALFTEKLGSFAGLGQGIDFTR